MEIKNVDLEPRIVAFTAGNQNIMKARTVYFLYLEIVDLIRSAICQSVSAAGDSIADNIDKKVEVFSIKASLRSIASTASDTPLK